LASMQELSYIIVRNSLKPLIGLIYDSHTGQYFIL
jgi:hypothetical protein